MRTILTDDDGSEWSIEILDDDHVNALAKPVKQTPPTTSSSPCVRDEIHPLLLNDFSTTATGAHLTGQEKAKRVDFATHQTQCSAILPTILSQVNHRVPITNRVKAETRPPKKYSIPNPLLHVDEQVHHKKQHSLEVTPLTRAKSSNSSTQSTSAKIDEEESSLPVYSFMEYDNPPAVVYTKSESEADSLVQTLSGPLGFDLEWRVMWHPGAQERRTALVQLCDHHTILLIQVNSMKRFPKKLVEIIESADIVKTGANILNDGEKLYRDFGIRAKGLVELGAFATRADDKFSTVYNREIVSLAKMVAMYLGRTLLKGKVRTSNWEAHLSHSMVEYAANDCHCALMVYDRIQEIAERDGKRLDLPMYSCQVNPRPMKPKSGSQPNFPQNLTRSTRPIMPSYCIPEPPRPQQLRAYKLWHVDKMPLDEMCLKLRMGDRVEPLKEGTVISYVVGALQADPRLPFDMNDLKALVHMEAGSWQRHRQWIASRE